jgi:tetratricopeptide (TPR) repeat protein/O-antigen ligase
MNENKFNHNRVVILDIMAKMIPVSLAFLVPIFFLPITLEFFGFNKLALVVVAAILLVIYWAAKMMLGEKISFTKSMVDLPLLAYFLVVALATFFSISKTDSIYGSQGRWVGFLSTTVLLAYFFLSTPLLKDMRVIKASLYGFLISSTLSSLVSVMTYYKFYVVATGFSQIQNFNLTGSIADTVFIAALALVVSLGLLGYERFLPTKVALLVSVFINYFFIAIVRVPLGYAVFASGVVGLLMYVNLDKAAKAKLSYGIATLLIVITTFLTILPGTSNILIDRNYPKEISLPVRESWLISTTVIQNYPLLATGPSTFYLNFSRYRPLSLNNGDLWNSRFDVPKNEFFNIMSTLGLVGLAVTFFLVIKILKIIGSAKLNEDDTGISKVISAVLLSILVGFLFIHASILTTFLLFSMLSMLVATHALVDRQVMLSEAITLEADALSSIAGVSETSVIKKEYFRFIMGVPMVLAAIYTSYLGYKNYAGEYYMRLSLNAAAKNDGTTTYNMQRNALTVNPTRDNYHTTYAQTNLAIANSIASNTDITDTDRQTIQNLIAQAIRSVRVATEVVGPLNPSNWEVRAIVYRSLINVAQNASDWAIGSYNSAIQLDPSNPRLRVELGGVYYSLGDYLSAANQFRQATALKQDYANAHFNFASALVQLKDYPNALASLDVTKSLIPEDSPDRKVVDDLVKSIQSPQVAGAATSKPTVEQIAGPTQGTGIQEPLINASQSPKVGDENLDLGTLPQPQTPAEEQTPEQPKQ